MESDYFSLTWNLKIEDGGRTGTRRLAGLNGETAARDKETPWHRPPSPPEHVHHSHTWVLHPLLATVSVWRPPVKDTTCIHVILTVNNLEKKRERRNTQTETHDVRLLTGWQMMWIREDFLPATSYEWRPRRCGGCKSPKRIQRRDRPSNENGCRAIA